MQYFLPPRIFKIKSNYIIKSNNTFTTIQDVGTPESFKIPPFFPTSKVDVNYDSSLKFTKKEDYPLPT